MLLDQHKIAVSHVQFQDESTWDITVVDEEGCRLRLGQLADVFSFTLDQQPNLISPLQGELNVYGSTNSQKKAKERFLNSVVDTLLYGCESACCAYVDAAFKFGMLQSLQEYLRSFFFVCMPRKTLQSSQDSWTDGVMMIGCNPKRRVPTPGLDVTISIKADNLALGASTKCPGVPASCGVTSL